MITVLISLFLVSLHMLVFFRSNEMILKCYAMTNFIIFSSQGLFIGLFGFSHPRFDPQKIDFVNQTLFYVIFFEIFLIGSFYLFSKKLSLKKIDFKPFSKLNELSNNGHLFFFIIIIFIIISSELVLINSNVFFGNSKFIECSNLEFFKFITSLNINSNFLQLIKITADFKYYLLLFSGLLFLQSKQNLNKNIFYIMLILCILMGIIKGQRSIILISLIFYCIVNYDNLKDFILRKPVFAIINFTVFSILTIVLARTISHLRNFFFYENNTCQKITSEIARELIANDINISKSFFLIDFYLTRLNYLIPFSKITEYVYNFGNLNGIQYLSNFFGLIPRYFWEGKPVITNNMNFFAYKSGLISAPDFSVGLRPIGESFLNFGWYGILIAFLIGFLFYFLNLFNKNKNIFIKSIYIYLLVYILKSDAYFAIFPGILHILIGWLVFF